MLYLYLLASFLLIATIAVSSYIQTSSNASAQKVERSSRAYLSHIYAINSSVLKTKTLAKDFIITNDEINLSITDSTLAYIDSELGTLTTEVDRKKNPEFPLYVRQEFFRYRDNVLLLIKKNSINLHSAEMINTDDNEARKELFVQYITNIQPDFNEFIDKNSISLLKIFNSYFQSEKSQYTRIVRLSLVYLICSSISLLLLLISFVWYIRRAVINPIKYLMDNTNKVSAGHFELAESPKFWKNEIKNYIDQFADLVSKLKSIEQDNQYAKWLRDGENLLYNQLISANDINEFYTITTTELCKRVLANSSIFYTFDRNSKKLVLSESYAAPANRKLKKEFWINEGLIGEYAMKDEVSIIKDIPKGYFSIASSLGYSDAAEIAFIPIRIDNALFGVLEVAAMKSFSESDLEYFRRASRIIASGLHIFLYRN